MCVFTDAGSPDWQKHACLIAHAHTHRDTRTHTWSKPGSQLFSIKTSFVLQNQHVALILRAAGKLGDGAASGIDVAGGPLRGDKDADGLGINESEARD